MTFTKKSELPDYAWADLVTLLREYFEPTDFEFEAYRKIYASTAPMRLIELNQLCANFVPPSAPATLDDYVSGAHTEINWQYALAALWCASCDEA